MLLFNNAGGPAPLGGIAGIPVDGFDAAFATNVRSVMLGMKHVAPIMIEQQAGSIINNGSVAGLRTGLSSSIVYSAAKAAVIHLTKCVAMELGEQNVRVNSVSPGGIATGIFGKALGVDKARADATSAIVKQGLAKMQPIPRAGLPEDIAYAAAFLASDEVEFHQRPRPRRRRRGDRRSLLDREPAGFESDARSDGLSVEPDREDEVLGIESPKRDRRRNRAFPG